MEPTLRIKVTLTDGTVIEIEKELPEAQLLLRSMPIDGYSDPSTGRFHPTESIHTIEVMPPEELPGFSDN
jgi:hypothetical protein